MPKINAYSSGWHSSSLSVLPSDIQAGIVRSDIAYQIYRDFAENKGLFVPGATDIPVYDKDGKLVGRLDKAPMADFSSVSSNGVATLVSPQYIVSVKHNGGYQSVSFGNGKIHIPLLTVITTLLLTSMLHV